MYLSLANTLATWARESATDDISRAVFSGTMFITGAAITVISAGATLQNMNLAREDIQRLVAGTSNPLRRVA